MSVIMKLSKRSHLMKAYQTKTCILSVRRITCNTSLKAFVFIIQSYIWPHFFLFLFKPWVMYHPYLLHVFYIWFGYGIVRKIAITRAKQVWQKWRTIINDKKCKYKYWYIKTKLSLVAFGYHSIHSTKGIGERAA